MKDSFRPISRTAERGRTNERKGWEELKKESQERRFTASRPAGDLWIGARRGGRIKGDSGRRGGQVINSERTGAELGVSPKSDFQSPLIWNVVVGEERGLARSISTMMSSSLTLRSTSRRREVNLAEDIARNLLIHSCRAKERIIRCFFIGITVLCRVLRLIIQRLHNPKMTPKFNPKSVGGRHSMLCCICRCN